MKAHIGVDADSGLVHPVIGTAQNVNDVTQGAWFAGVQIRGKMLRIFDASPVHASSRELLPLNSRENVGCADLP